MIHIQIHGTVALGCRCHRLVDIADRSDDIFGHITLANREVLQIFRNSVVDFQGSSKIRVTVRYKIALTNAVEVTHAAIRTTFYADIDPEVFITHDHFQDLQCPVIFLPCVDKVACLCRKLYFRRSFKSFILLFTVQDASALWRSLRIKSFF